MMTIAIGDVLQRIHNLPSLPTVVMELLASLNQDDVDIDVLAQKITQDQGLTARTLRLANSSFYGMTSQVTTIQEAIAILGFRTVRSIATTTALMGTFSRGAGSSFNATPFWRHSIAAAVCARELAPFLHLSPENAYIAGLIHDIGRLVLVTQFQPNFEATMVYRTQHDCSVLDAERAVLGIDHALVGQLLTRHWKFPETIQQAIASHHEKPAPHAPPLQMLILAADTIAHALDLSLDEDDLVPPVPPGLWQQIGLDDNKLMLVFKNAEKQFASASLLLTT